ncbi:MAG: hypothetical protein UW18_C0017G0013 [Microgenomates group bacterium GW2011_GWF1_44_10]|nr:MAG: hypothetical protein UW18_C0017G0013 [Microgenomates group bacterium GW2011_GWF1_44_10]
MTGTDQFKAMGERIKRESEETKPKEELAPVREEEITKAVATMDVIKENQELAKRYQQASKMGSENLSGGMPILKIHSIGRSTNELSDGSEPNNGWFYYKPTKQQFETIDCHILAISRGFNTPKLGGKPGETTYQHLLSGVMKVDGEYAPFVIYLNSAGHRNRMYAFGKQIHQFTHQRPIGIPMFALSIKLFTVQEKYEFTGDDGKKMSGKSWVMDYELKVNEDGSPVLVGDVREFDFLEESVIKAQEMMESMITSKVSEEAQPAVMSDETAIQGEEVFTGKVKKDEEIPF